MLPHRKFAVAAVAIAALLQACAPDDGATTLQATRLPEPMALPEFDLIDQDGNEFNRDSLRNQWTLLFFGFTNCPDICPATLQQLAIARSKLLAARPDMPQPTIVLISVDPARDSVDSLRDYVAYFGDSVQGVTGDPEDLMRLSGSLGIYFEKQPGDNGDYSVSHSTAVLLINRAAEFHAVLSAPVKVETLVHDLPILMSAK